MDVPVRHMSRFVLHAYLIIISLGKALHILDLHNDRDVKISKAG